MSNRTESGDAQENHPDAIARWDDAIARRDNEGGAPANEKHNGSTWFVPPVAIPVALVTLIVARVIALAYFGAPFS
jgi:hypothetical protein